VNDRVDLAAASGAHGVHLGQTDLPVREARALLGPGRLIGVSVEDAAQAARAEADGADYLGVGPIYATGSKADAGPAVGTEQLIRLRRATRLPLVAIGGITRDRVAATLAAGAAAVAVIGAVAAAPDPETAARELAAACEAAHGG
jgi:thiamine-phosphate pyrophosphorylase